MDSHSACNQMTRLIIHLSWHVNLPRWLAIGLMAAFLLVVLAAGFELPVNAQAPSATLNDFDPSDEITYPAWEEALRKLGYPAVRAGDVKVAVGPVVGQYFVIFYDQTTGQYQLESFILEKKGERIYDVYKAPLPQPLPADVQTHMEIITQPELPLPLLSLLSTGVSVSILRLRRKLKPETVAICRS